MNPDTFNQFNLITDRNSTTKYRNLYKNMYNDPVDSNLTEIWISSLFIGC